MARLQRPGARGATPYSSCRAPENRTDFIRLVASRKLQSSIFGAVNETFRGSSARSGAMLAPQPCIRLGPCRTRTMKQLFASAVRLRGTGQHGRLFFHTALTREAARSRPARLKWSHLLNTSATTLRRYSLNILKELGKV